jgi:hypothetical protein
VLLLRVQALMEGLRYVQSAITFEGFIPKDEGLHEKLQDVQYYLEVRTAIVCNECSLLTWAA